MELLRSDTAAFPAVDGSTTEGRRPAREHVCFPAGDRPPCPLRRDKSLFTGGRGRHTSTGRDVRKIPVSESRQAPAETPAAVDVRRYRARLGTRAANSAAAATHAKPPDTMAKGTP